MLIGVSGRAARRAAITGHHAALFLGRVDRGAPAASIRCRRRAAVRAVGQGARRSAPATAAATGSDSTAPARMPSPRTIWRGADDAHHERSRAPAKHGRADAGRGERVRHGAIIRRAGRGRPRAGTESRRPGTASRRPQRAGPAGRKASPPVPAATPYRARRSPPRLRPARGHASALGEHGRRQGARGIDGGGDDAGTREGRLAGECRDDPVNVLVRHRPEHQVARPASRNGREVADRLRERGGAGRVVGTIEEQYRAHRHG